MNLEYLTVEGYNRKLKNVPLSLNAMEIPRLPENLFEVDADSVNKIKARYYFW